MIEWDSSLIIVVYGDTAVGKTHWASLEEDTMILDCSGEARLISMKLGRAYTRITKYEDLTKDFKAKFLVVDTLAGFKRICGEELCKRLGLKQVYPPPLWGQVYDL